MSSLSLTLLGQLAVTWGERPLTTFRSNRVPALLAYLAVEAGRPQRREALTELLWPGLPAASARQNLRQTLYLLRQAIPNVAANGDDGAVPLLVSDRHTVQLNPDGDVTLDVARLVALTNGQSTPEALQAAAALYQGDFLADFYLPDSENFEAWAAARRAAYQRLVLDALGRLTAVHLQDADFTAAEATARRQLELDNLRESGHRQLLETLARSGRRRAALSHYENVRGLLQSELAIDPSPETQALIQAIRDGELRAEQGGRAAHDGERPASLDIQEETDPVVRRQRRHNLPAQPTPFIGRAAELAALDNLLTDPDTRLVTIVGPGGMGKTRLALAAAERYVGAQSAAPEPFPHGVFFVDLAPLNDAGQMVSAVADALRLPLEGGERAPRRQLLDYLRHKQLLLLCDNFEHLLATTSPESAAEEAAGLVADILQTALGVRILVTSRERLRLRAEQRFPIEGLALPEREPGGEHEDAAGNAAVQLFLQAARRNQPGFAPRDAADRVHLARICHLVMGMPLALEMAAAWVDMLPLAEIAAELRRGLDLLETDLHDMPERHRSIRAALDYSWQKLDEQERAIFIRLSVFRGGFTHDAAQAVAGANLRQLARLVNRSLLQVTIEGGRYRLHELLRHFGLEKLRERGEETAVRDRHGHFFCTSLRHWQEGLPGNRLRSAAEWIDANYRNIETAWAYALEQGHWEQLLVAVDGLGTYFDANGRWLEGIQHFQETGQRLRPDAESVSKTAEAARLLIWSLAWEVNLSLNNQDAFVKVSHESYRHLLQSALDLLALPSLTGQDCRAEEAYLRLLLGRVLKTIDGQWENGEAHLADSLRLYRELEDTLGIAEALFQSHFYFLDDDSNQRTTTRLEEVTALLQQADEPFRLNRTRLLTAALYYELGDIETASMLWEAAYDIARKAGHLHGMLNARFWIMHMAIGLGLHDLSVQANNEMLALAEQINSPSISIGALCSKAGSQMYRGEFRQALDTFQEARRAAQEVNLPANLPWESLALPQISLHTGDYDAVSSWLKTFDKYWPIMVQQMWVSLVKQEYAETISLATQATTLLDSLDDRKGGAEIGTPLALALYYLGREDEARRNLARYLHTCLELRAAFVQLVPLIPVIARVLADTEAAGQKERAVELWAMAQAHPFVGNSRMFADLLAEPLATAAADLPPAVAAAAQARGRVLEWWPTAAVLLDELRELSWEATESD